MSIWAGPEYDWAENNMAQSDWAMRLYLSIKKVEYLFILLIVFLSQI